MVTGVITILTQDATVQSLVGLNSTDEKYKIYPVIVPQKETYPYITVRQTSKVRIGKGCGFMSGIDITSYHKSYDQVLALDNAVFAAIENNGTFLSLTSTSDGWVQADGDGLYSRTSTYEGAET